MQTHIRMQYNTEQKIFYNISQLSLVLYYVCSDTSIIYVIKNVCACVCVPTCLVCSQLCHSHPLSTFSQTACVNSALDLPY